MARLLRLCIAAFCFLFSVHAVQLHRHNSSFAPDAVLRITSGNHSIACNTRQSAFINGTSPGPELRLQGGQTTWIRVYNDMQDANLTMHWHGLSQRTAIFSDGTPEASQWPIPPLHFFDYEIRPEKSDAGTYFYHAHVGFQAVTVFGPLIIEDSGPPPYKYDDERIIMVSDFFNETDHQIETGLVADPFVWSGETNAILVNGVGISNWNPQLSSNSPSCGLAVIDVEPGKTYRMRAIGATALTVGVWGIEGHSNLSVIAADGQYTKPASTDHIQTASGQRFDFLLHTKSAEELARSNKTTFYIQLENRFRPTNATGYAVLRYSKNTAVPPAPQHKVISLPQDITRWLEYTLQPLKPNNFPRLSEVTRRVNIKLEQTGGSNVTIIWQENAATWTETTRSSPYLVDIYKHGQAAVPSMERAAQYGGWDPKFDAWPAQPGEVLEIVLENAGSVPGAGSFDVHPFHAHGGHFYDIGSGNGSYDAQANEARFANYTPVLRDTTMLYKYTNGNEQPGDLLGWRAWRLRVEDAGVWMIHCHILQHMIMGMQMVWVFGDAAEITAIPHPLSQGYLTYGGSAYGNSTFSPWVAHQFDD